MMKPGSGYRCKFAGYIFLIIVNIVIVSLGIILIVRLIRIL